MDNFEFPAEYLAVPQGQEGAPPVETQPEFNTETPSGENVGDGGVNVPVESTPPSNESGEGQPSETPFWSEYGTEDEVKERLIGYGDLQSNFTNVSSELEELKANQFQFHHPLLESLHNYVAQSGVTEEADVAKTVQEYYSLQMTDFNSMNELDVVRTKMLREGYDSKDIDLVMADRYELEKPIEVPEDISDLDRMQYDNYNRQIEQRNRAKQASLKVDSMNARTFMNKVKADNAVPKAYKERQETANRLQASQVKALNDLPNQVNQFNLEVEDFKFNLNDQQRAQILGSMKEMLPSLGNYDAQTVNNAIRITALQTFLPQILSAQKAQLKAEWEAQNMQELHGVGGQQSTPGQVANGVKSDQQILDDMWDQLNF